MNLATAILFGLIGLGGHTLDEIQEATPAPAQQTAPQDSQVKQPSATTNTSQNSSSQVKPPLSKRRRTRNCPASSSTVGTGNQTGSRQTASVTGTPGNPCPPPKKVVRNGGSQEPVVELVGGANPQHPTSTDELTAATEENLKKVTGRQLTDNQQQTVSQIKEFIEQSKTAISAGDAERGHTLAMKARMLSDELVKP
jgi:hypothetical protein